jgi:hypothetical protein
VPNEESHQQHQLDVVNIHLSPLKIVSLNMTMTSAQMTGQYFFKFLQILQILIESGIMRKNAIEAMLLIPFLKRHTFPKRR